MHDLLTLLPYQTTIAVLVCGWAHVLHAVYKPWGKGSVLYMLQHGSLFVTSFVFLMGLLFKVKGVEATTPVYNALSAVMLGMCTMFLAVWFGLMCHRIALTLVSKYPKLQVLSSYRRLCRYRLKFSQGAGEPVVITRTRSSSKGRSRLAATTVTGMHSDPEKSGSALALADSDVLLPVADRISSTSGASGRAARIRRPIQVANKLTRRPKLATSAPASQKSAVSASKLKVQWVTPSRPGSPDSPATGSAMALSFHRGGTEDPAARSFQVANPLMRRTASGPVFDL